MERALIIQKQYLDLIFNNGKIWEMRSTKTNVRGRIGLIESGSGLIVGEAILTGCGKPLNEFTALITAEYHQVVDFSLLKKWKYPWSIDEVKKYDEPIPYKHPKGAVIWVKLNK